MSQPSGFEGVPPHILKAWREQRPRRVVHDPGPEWLSMKQLMALWHVTSEDAREHMQEMLAKGTAERGTRDVPRRGRAGSQSWYPIIVYRLKGARRAS